MISVTKSPNMMSTTGRIPVIAAPSARPVMPGSEIGESTTRSVPNSSTSPARTLNGVPASATSSPITKTVGSRRISSRNASFTAWESVSSRVPTARSTVDMVRHLARVRVRRVERERDGVVHLGLAALADALPLGIVAAPRREQRDRVALRPPALLLVLRAVVGAVDVADVMALIPVRRAGEEARAVAAPRTLDGARRRVVHGEHVLAVDLLGGDAERLGARRDRARRHVLVARVLVVEVVLTDVDDRELPERGHVHHLVEEALAERALAEEADRDPVGPERFPEEAGAGADPRRSADDRVRAEVAVRVVGDVHRAALALAVALLLAEQLAVHEPHVGALGDAVAVAAMRGGDRVVAAQRRADADRDRLLADVEMSQARHLRREVELVRLRLEGADAEHALDHRERELPLDRKLRLGGHQATDPLTPAIAASTSKTMAKS